MSNAAFIRKHRLRIGATLALLALLALGAFASVRAQGQICRDVVNLTVCGDSITTNPNDPEEFNLKGNIKVGPRGGPLLLHATDMEPTFKGREVSEATRAAQFLHLKQPDPNAGTTDVLAGKLRFINDSNTTPLLATHYTDDPADPDGLVAGRLFVDIVNQRIFIPAEGAVPIFKQKGSVRNSMMLFPFMDRAALRSFYK
jgi:hypothetical protein